MKFLLPVFLFVLDAIHADLCLLEESEPDCEGYCYKSVKPFLSYVPSLQKRLEACEALYPKSHGEDKLNSINDKLAQQLKVIKLWETRFHEFQRFQQKQNNFFEGCNQKLLATELKLKNMEEQLKKQVEKVDTLESKAMASEIIFSDHRNLVKIYESGRNKFTKLGDKYYYIENNETQSWLGALQKCAQWGGHLASLQSEEEWKNITKELTKGKRYWIDLNDIQIEGSFLSATTGGPAEFLKWFDGQPNNYLERQDCVELGYMDTFEMTDDYCQLPLYFICESNTQ